MCSTVHSKCQLIQLLVYFWMAKFCLLIVYQTAVIFNKDVYNSIISEEVLKKEKVLVESN